MQYKKKFWINIWKTGIATKNWKKKKIGTICNFKDFSQNNNNYCNTMDVLNKCFKSNSTMHWTNHVHIKLCT